MLTILFLCVWRTVATVHGYVRAYAPSNIAIDYLRSEPGLKLAIPVAVIAVPVYLFVARLVTTFVDGGATDWFLLVALVAFIDALKFAALAALTPPLLVWRRLDTHRATRCSK
ncbi:hypothetical protein FB381_2726 [Nocardioides albertanoniae]|uniref:Uncharacterized protein n=2 Tax=Nocardioides TaxID=1839 RepID=A0A543A8A1_9ACTN|nr:MULTISPECIES: hypothetical protein [Nocardioides]NYI77126.1 hypothetical protein [Nocardioides panzhihuensis]TQL68828.1 hypothetical protein FB381_2726 [Nocardioides albertanoniae]